MIEVKQPSPTKALKEGEVDRVYRLLKSWLMECQFAPGQSLAEVDLARRRNQPHTCTGSL